MKLLLDMNLPRRWVVALTERGHEAVMWRDVGDRRAADIGIVAYAAEHRLVVVTRDLDFGEILAATGTLSPSVVLVRARGPQLDSIVPPLLVALQEHAEAMSSGALLLVSARGVRVRLLPLRPVH